MSNGLQDHPLIHPVQVEIYPPGFEGKITEQRMIGGGRAGKHIDRGFKITGVLLSKVGIPICKDKIKIRDLHAR